MPRGCCEIYCLRESPQYPRDSVSHEMVYADLGIRTNLVNMA